VILLSRSAVTVRRSLCARAGAVCWRVGTTCDLVRLSLARLLHDWRWLRTYRHLVGPPVSAVA
jgi:hypothetical protein